jgi:hypothetical protein
MDRQMVKKVDKLENCLYPVADDDSHHTVWHSKKSILVNQNQWTEVNTVINVSCCVKCGEFFAFLTGWGRLAFVRRSLLGGILYPVCCGVPLNLHCYNWLYRRAVLCVA